MMLDKYDAEFTTVLHKGECDEAAIFGQDGTGWYWSLGFPELNVDSTVLVEGMTEAENKNVTINEFKCIMGAAAGQRNPSEAGIRIDGTKYMMVMNDPETGLTQLTRKGGGGALMKTTHGIVCALFTKDKQCVDLNGAPVKGKY